MAGEASVGFVLKVINGVSGDLLATFSADSSSTVAQAARQLESSSGSPWTEYKLSRGTTVLQSSSTLQEALGCDGGFVELTAFALSVLKIEVCSKVMGACVLPLSGDIVLASQGNLTRDGPEPAVLGDDGGDTSSIWLWRLSAASGWSLSKAILLARRFGCVPEEMKPAWDSSEDAQRIWTPAEIEAGKSSGVIPFPGKLRSWQAVCLHAYNDAYALLAWNQCDYFGGRGVIERIDINSGQLLHVANVFDVLALTTDPRDGRIFVTTGYDGTDILLINGSTVLEPGQLEDTRHHRILSNACNVGSGLCFDVVLGALVATVRKSESCFFVLCPPDSSTLAVASAQPGAEVLESIRGEDADRTPGDRSSPWACVSIPINGAEVIGSVKAVAAHAGRVTYLGQFCGKVYSVGLVRSGTDLDSYNEVLEVAAWDQPIDAIAFANDHPVALLTHVDSPFPMGTQLALG